MQIIKTKSELRQVRRELDIKSKTLALIPTMGALHEGHLSLYDIAKEHADMVMFYIFVNSKQFNDTKDFAKYPKTIDEDIKLLEEKGVQYLYLPDIEQIYPEGFNTIVEVQGSLTNVLCGATRPGHFAGVSLVLTKFFNQVRPEIVVMGQKDYQQLLVVKKLCRDLDFDIEVIGAPTSRENSGLARSSRNRLLTAESRMAADKLPSILSELRESIIDDSSVVAVQQKIGLAKQKLLDSGFEKIDYLEIRSGEDLSEINDIKEPARIFVAVFVGGVRLIDNIAI